MKQKIALVVFFALALAFPWHALANYVYFTDTVASGQVLYFSAYEGGYGAAVCIPSDWPDSMKPVGALVIPDSVTYGNYTYVVTTIYDHAFEGCTGLTSVIIPEAVYYLGSYAFYGCVNLASVNIPSNVSVIRQYTFCNCSSLASITIPYGVTSIGYYAFHGDTALTSVSLPNTVTTLDYAAFDGCTGLTSLTIPASVTSISWSFRDCTGLTSIVVDPANPVYDSRNGCNAIIATANNELIQGCPATVIPATVTSIGELAFSSCASMTSINIPNSVTTIQGHAFYRCTGLTSVTFPSSLTYISPQAFSECTGLTTVTFSNGITSITGFDWCTSLTTVNIPASVTSIGEDAFYCCTALTTLPMGENVTSIGMSAYGGCTGLTSVVIPEGVTSIGSGAFFDCWYMTSLVLPSTLTYIGQAAFSYCRSLTSVVIPDGVSYLEDAFSFCRALTSVTIGSGITSIADYTFFTCDSLKTITCLAATPPTVGENVFVHNNNTSYVDSSTHLYVPCASVAAYQAAPGWSEFINIHGIALYSVGLEESPHGAVAVVQPTCDTSAATLTATPDAGYAFDHWNDGNTDNPRTVAVTQDTTFSAVFVCIPCATADSAVACDSYTWNSAVYTADTMFVDTAYNVYGCDSSHVFRLKVNHSYHGGSTVALCDSYV